MKNFLYVSLLASSILSASSVYAVEKTTTFEVKLTINESCVFGTPSGIDFGELTRSGAAETKSGTLTANCTLGTPYSIVLDGNREMVNKSDSAFKVKYELYQDATHKDIWGKTGSGQPREGVGSGLDQPLTVYAKLIDNTNVKAGIYLDEITTKIIY